MSDAVLIFNGTAHSLPIETGTNGEQAVDLSSLRATTGLIGLDPGFQNTASCRSAITFVDGENGILQYRGFPIESLAVNVSFLDVAQLLIRGELPSPSASEAFARAVRNDTLGQNHWTSFLANLPAQAPPMAVLASGINMLSMYFPQFFVDDGDPDTFEAMVSRLFSSFLMIAVSIYRRARGESIVPGPELDYSSQFLRMMFSQGDRAYEVPPERARILDALLVLHADHEQNCSTSAVRLVGSSRVNLYSSVCAGICALWGPLHGGANQRVMEMLERIRSENLSISTVLRQASEGRFRLSGFGHRVYKTYDPRARILKELSVGFLSRLSTDDPYLETALALEQAALAHPYFQDRRLYPNVDFYSGLLYRALGIPNNMFPVMFAMGRLPGWVAHWKEMHDTTPFKIGRPRQLYVGPRSRHTPHRAAKPQESDT